MTVGVGVGVGDGVTVGVGVGVGVGVTVTVGDGVGLGVTVTVGVGVGVGVGVTVGEGVGVTVGEGVGVTVGEGVGVTVTVGDGVGLGVGEGVGVEVGVAVTVGVGVGVEVGVGLDSSTGLCTGGWVACEGSLGISGISREPPPTAHPDSITEPNIHANNWRLILKPFGIPGNFPKPIHKQGIQIMGHSQLQISPSAATRAALGTQRPLSPRTQRVSLTTPRQAADGPPSPTPPWPGT